MAVQVPDAILTPFSHLQNEFSKLKESYLTAVLYTTMHYTVEGLHSVPNWRSLHTNDNVKSI